MAKGQQRKPKEKRKPKAESKPKKLSAYAQAYKQPAAQQGFTIKKEGV
jgi:hypothetical protein